jgi:hypothetical protein
MKKGVLLFLLTLHLPVIAAEELTIDVGDYLFVEATIIDCGPDRHTVAYDEVDAKGEVTLFSDIQLTVKGKTVHHVVSEIVNILVKRTGYRSKTIEIVRVPGSNEQEVARRLMGLLNQQIPNCRSIFKPGKDQKPYPVPVPVPVPNWDYDYLLAQKKAHNKTLKYVQVNSNSNFNQVTE